MADFSRNGAVGLGRDSDTLDEPVSLTIVRDLAMVGNKLICVLNPRNSNIQMLKNWDLWGPLIICLMLATMLSWFAPHEQMSLVFASVFVIISCGAAVVTVNALLLGGQMSFFQSVCVLGYCVFPLNIASAVCLVGGHIAWCAAKAFACFYLSDTHIFPTEGGTLIQPVVRLFRTFPSCRLLGVCLCVSYMGEGYVNSQLIVTKLLRRHPHVVTYAGER